MVNAAPPRRLVAKATLARWLLAQIVPPCAATHATPAMCADLVAYHFAYELLEPADAPTTTGVCHVDHAARQGWLGATCDARHVCYCGCAERGVCPGFTVYGWRALLCDPPWADHPPPA
jgi:hypothetical protein